MRRKIIILGNKLTRGGAEAVIVSQVNLLHKSGYDVYLGLLRSTNKDDTFYENLHIPKDHLIHFGFGSLFNPISLFRIISFLKREYFHMIITHLFESNFIGRIAAFFARVPIITSTEHSVYFVKSKWQIIVNRWLSKLTDVIFGVSSIVVDFTVEQENIPREKFEVLQQIVDPSISLFSKSDILQKFGISDDRMVVITVARFSEEKGVQKIPQIASLCKKSLGKDMPVFLVAGYGPLESDLRSEIDKHNLGKDVFVIADSVLAKEYLAAGDVFLLPSNREGMPVAMLEAMANNLVPVGSRVGGVPEIVQPGNGFIIEKDNLKGFADNLISLSKNREDLNKRKIESKKRAINYIKKSGGDFLEKVDKLFGKIESGMKFVITVDTEGDNQWKEGNIVSLSNIKSLPRFQELCEKYNFIPTYLITDEVATDSFSIDLLSNWQDLKKAEVGSHLHPWTSPSLVDRLKGEHVFPSELTREEFKKALTDLTDSIESGFKIKPTSYRAGRWGFNNMQIKVLEELGYIVDCSVSPKIDWRNTVGKKNSNGGPDFRGLKTRPYYFSDSKVLEVPITILYTGLFSKVEGYMEKLFSKMDDGFLKRVFNRLFFQMKWTRVFPESSVSDWKKILKTAQKNNLPVIEFMIHSSELSSGTSPYTKTPESVERVYRELENMFRIFSEAGLVGIGLSDFARNFKKGYERVS